VLAVAGVLWADSALSITGAGATFPYPMYSKWFDEYHKKNANLEINYQSIGSAAALSRSRSTVDFGATDGPMNDDQLKAFQDKHGFGILHFPTVLGADVPAYNIPGMTAELQSPRTLSPVYSWARLRNGVIPRFRPEQRSEPPRKRHRRGASLGRQRYNLHLDRLSFKGQRGVENQSWQRCVGQLPVV